MSARPNTDTSVAAAEAQAGVLRCLPPARRLELAVEMSLLARALLRARVRTEHPAWSETAVNRQVLRLVLPDVVLPHPAG